MFVWIGRYSYLDALGEDAAVNGFWIAYSINKEDIGVTIKQSITK